MKLNLTEEQQKAYNRFIRARDEIKLVKTAGNFKKPYIPHRQYLDSIQLPNENHCQFIRNDEWWEYLEASQAWWDIEPRFRHEQRMRATRGDYGVEDNWEDDRQDVVDLYQYFKED